MTGPVTPRRGQHRAADGARLLRGLVAPVVTVAAVSGFIALLLVLQQRPSGPGSPTVTAPSPTGPTAATSPAASSPPAAGPSASPSPAPSPSSPTSAPSGSATPAAAPRPPLTVLNNSRRAGLAARAAEQFRRAGWPVAEVGNFRGRIPVTTAYYAAGQQPAAQALAARFPGIRRVLPRFAGLPGQGLTVVLTRYWPDP